MTHAIQGVHCAAATPVNADGRTIAPRAKLNVIACEKVV